MPPKGVADEKQAGYDAGKKAFNAAHDKTVLLRVSSPMPRALSSMPRSLLRTQSTRLT